MKFRIALPVAMAALFMVGTAPIASAKTTKKHTHMMKKGPGAQVKVGVAHQTATGGPSGGSKKSASGGGN